jgi:hypothetical protein
MPAAGTSYFFRSSSRKTLGGKTASPLEWDT